MSVTPISHPLVETFNQAGQGQVFAFWGELDEAGRAALLAQAAEIDLAEVARLSRTLLGAAATALLGAPPDTIVLSNAGPAPASVQIFVARKAVSA